MVDERCRARCSGNAPPWTRVTSSRSTATASIHRRGRSRNVLPTSHRSGVNRVDDSVLSGSPSRKEIGVSSAAAAGSASFRRAPTRGACRASSSRLRRADRPGFRWTSTCGHGALPHEPPRGARLIELVADAGLRGRDGAGFPTAAKLRAVVARVGGLSSSQRLRGRACEREDPRCYAWRRISSSTASGWRLPRWEHARRSSAIAGRPYESWTRSTSRSRSAWTATRRSAAAVRLLVPESFVSGEETALVNFLNGGPPKPTFTPPRPFERGVAGRPTLVQNVETLAHLALVGRHGPAWFRALGAERNRVRPS